MFQSPKDKIAAFFLGGISLVAALAVALIFVFLCKESGSALTQLKLRIFTDSGWYPADDAVSGSFGMLPMIWTTLVVTAAACLLAAPLAIFSVLFCQYYAPPFLAVIYHRAIEILAGIPSVVYGFWGLSVLAPLIGRLHPPGPSLLAGIIILAIMILPTMALLIDASLRNIPEIQLKGAAALGLSKITIIKNISFVYAKRGMLTGLLLGLARAAGETMAVLMVCGNVIRNPNHLFASVRTLTANMALEMGYSFGVHRSALYVSGLLLFIMMTVLILMAEFASGKKTLGECCT